MSSGIQAFEHMRRYLWQVLEQGSLDTNMAQTVLTALESSNPRWLPSVFHLIRIQDLEKPLEQEEQPQPEPLFREPSEHQLRGQIFIGNSIPSGHRVFLDWQSFGQPGHIGAYGTTGAGKSWLLHLIAAQLMTGGITTIIHDVTDQAAPILVPIVPADRLNVLDYSDYRRNPLIGPKHILQLNWLRMALDSLTDSFGLTPVGMNCLIQICDSIIAEGSAASIPAVIEKAQSSKFKSPSLEAVLNRLLPLVMKGDLVFACERGFDLDKFFSRSCILNVKDVAGSTRRLIFNDQYLWLTRSQRALTTWQLKTVFMIHEAREILSHASEFFLNMVAQARNYGIGFVFANQTPQVEDATVRSNIGTKLIFRLEDAASLEGFRVGLSLNEEQRNFILNMPPRLMLVRRPDIPYPFLVKVPELV